MKSSYYSNHSLVFIDNQIFRLFKSDKSLTKASYSDLMLINFIFKLPVLTTYCENLYLWEADFK